MSKKSPKNNNETPTVQVSDLSGNGKNPFDVAFDSDLSAAIKADLGLLGIKKISFKGTITATNKGDWTVSGAVGASVTQACVVSLAPVKTRIDAPVTRLFVKHFEYDDVETDEDNVAEMPENVETDPLGDAIDLGLLAQEVIALNLPDYPRAPDAQLENTQFTEPGTAPMTDDDAKPFASLAALKDKLQK